MKRSCVCPEWQISAALLDSLMTIAAVHGASYDGGKPFVYCPWCGTKLQPSSETQISDHEKP